MVITRSIHCFKSLTRISKGFCLVLGNSQSFPSMMPFTIIISTWDWVLQSAPGGLQHNFQFKLHRVLCLKANIGHHLGGLSNAVQPNLPFLKSDRTRYAAWLTSPLNTWIASFSMNLYMMMPNWAENGTW